MQGDRFIPIFYKEDTSTFCPQIRKSSEPVNCSVLEAESDDTLALAVLHNEVQSEVLNKVVAVIPTQILSLISISIFKGQFREHLGAYSRK